MGEIQFSTGTVGIESRKESKKKWKETGGLTVTVRELPREKASYPYQNKSIHVDQTWPAEEGERRK